MKKTVSMAGILLIIFAMCISVFAGDIPETVLNDTNAKLYIGRVDGRTTLAEGTMPYEENKVINIDITPIYKYKGDVKIGVSESYKKHNFGTFIPENDKEYLFAYIDENNFYIYDIESWSEKNIKLVDSDKYDMTKRLEVYINDGGFAMAEQERSTLGEQITFEQFLCEKPLLSDLDVDKVSLRYQDDVYEVNKEEFLNLAQSIKITNVKDDTLYEVKADPNTKDAYKSVLYIELIDNNNQLVSFCAVSRFGEVDRYGLFMGRLMAKDYEMKPEDLSKLYSLFPASVQKRIMRPESLPASVETLPMKLPEKPIKDYTGIVIISAIVVFTIAFVAGFICKKKQK